MLKMNTIVSKISLKVTVCNFFIYFLYRNLLQNVERLTMLNVTELTLESLTKSIMLRKKLCLTIQCHYHTSLQVVLL